MDDMLLRSSKIHVERAKFEAKGAFNPDLRKKRKKVDKRTKQKQVDKLLNWDEHPEVVRHKNERIIVIKNAFDLQQFQVNQRISLRRWCLSLIASRMIRCSSIN